ncbi:MULTISPECIES: Na+/H+ antiporter NhaC family protein [unclassified Microbacterium]|uniref:Na+/H+ antiporter NhaC family protein n=1 Tax=unclassified Microbacterium TaxID=2609290 RepID=UPI00097EFCC8|nr:Na+/H+ antiporter NhaC family protein [Microbacterium sp. JB110]RCS57680.1 Na+/H+ antiporter NhaC family protein [Microbacterium sp. JB110]SJM45876.1 Na+/H+ antiporter [Frigoribacterium sp. JB110]
MAAKIDSRTTEYTAREQLALRGGWGVALVPLAVFVGVAVWYFAGLQTFDFLALTAGALIGLLVGSLFARSQESYWNAVFRGVGSSSSVTIVTILAVVGMYAQLIKTTGLAEGMVWVATSLGVSGAVFLPFTFVVTCLVALSTGSSIGTMFTIFPVLYTAGVALGAPEALLAGAIVSGAIFGDHLAPISDTTIISSSSQRFRVSGAAADVAGVVRARARYALTAAAIALVFFVVAGLVSGSGDAPEAAGDPTGLLMLIPVAVMLIVAIAMRSLFVAITAGLVVGTITALAAGLLEPASILGLDGEGNAAGFLVGGLAAILPTIALVLAVFGIMGVLIESGVIERTTRALAGSRLAATPAGAETVIALGTSLVTVAYGGVNSAAMATFGPIVDRIGAAVGLHPYRRANIMDCFAMGLSCVVPLLSAFVFIAATLTDLPPAAIFVGCVYPLVLTVVMVVAIATGWGRRFEAPSGEQMRRRV